MGLQVKAANVKIFHYVKRNRTLTYMRNLGYRQAKGKVVPVIN